jgi:ribosomal protein S18 acetylase RimI-like enzyme
MGPIQVRRLTAGDAEDARRVCAAFDWSLNEDALALFLASPTEHLLVAYKESQPCGITVVHELRRLDGLAPKFFLYTIDTLPAYQRQGVASAIMEEVKRIGREINTRGLFLITNESNTAAMALYRSTGGCRKATDEAMFEYEI